MSKGSSPRPFSISQEEFGNRLESIFGKKPQKPQYVPPPLPSASTHNDDALNAYNNERLVSKFDKQILSQDNK